MQRLGLYLFRQIGVVFLITTITVVFVVLFAQSFRLLSFVVDNAGTLAVFFQLLGLMMLTFLPIVAPLSLGIAVVFTYNKLAMDSELIVMRSVGTSPLYLARPALVLACLVVGFCYSLSLWVTPWANGKLVAIQSQVRDNFSFFLVKSGTFNDLTDGLTFYSKKRGANGELEGILIHDVRNPRRPVTIMAERGKLLLDEQNVPQVIVFKGLRQEINNETGRLSQMDFDRYIVELQIAREKSDSRQPDPREQATLSLFEKALATPDPLVDSKTSIPKVVAELNQRLTSPILALGFCLIGITSILAGPFSRRGRAKRIILAASLIVILQAGSLSLTTLTGKEDWALPALYLLTLIPIPICLLALRADYLAKKPLLLKPRPAKEVAP